jgi:predicted AlkP superfamily phosphohydrolase/phosphomutase
VASPTRILFLGIDSADKDLILQWSSMGLLPTFSRLLEQSAWGVTTTPVGFYVGAVWPSFATGVSAARHGRYNFSQLKTGMYQTYRHNSFDLEGDRFWDVLSASGQRVAIIDVPLTPPSERIHGMQITDWGVHKANKQDVFHAYPPTLASEVEAEFGRNPIPRCNDIDRTPEGFQQFVEAMIARTNAKEKLSTKYLRQGPWDLFLTVFTEPHCVGHQCWHLHDPRHALHDPHLAASLGDPLLAGYRALDASIGRLISEVDKDTYVFVYSSHGMGPQDGVNSFLERILLRLEHHDAARRPTPARTSLADRLARKVRTYARNPGLLLWRLRKLMDPGLEFPVPDFAAVTLHVEDRRFFMLSNNDACGAIRINVVGREPQGKVAPGEPYEQVCRQLVEDLKAIVYVETGEPVVKEVLRTSARYQGHHLADLPDLIVEWNRKESPQSIESAKIGRLHNSYSGVRTGDHKPEGVVFVTGPGVPAGEISTSISALDFAPTLARLLDVQLPEAEGACLPCIERAITASVLEPVDSRHEGHPISKS